MTETILWPRKTRELHNHHFDSTIWNHLQFRDDDIIIATYAKSGTTWMQQIIAQMLCGPDADLEVAEMSPWLDLRVPPQAVKLPVVEAQTHRRFLKTHLPVDALIFSPQAKYLYLGRDGRDVVWSLYNHHMNANPKWYAALNDTPGRVGPPIEPPPSDIRQYWHEWLERDGYPFWSFWENVRTWWEIRHLPNVLFVHFANLKRDMPGQMRHIGAFLDIPINETCWDTILEYCSFDWMKQHATKSVPLGGAFWDAGAQVFIHQGVNGRWAETLTPAEVAEYEARAVQELGPECARWLATGEGLDRAPGLGREWMRQHPTTGSADALQPALRCGFQARLSRSVRPEREAVMEEQPSASRKDELAGKQETKHLWLLLFYGVVLLTILLSHFGLMRDVEGSTVALLLILALPFLLPYLKSIEAFGVKVDLRDEVRELKNEVRDTKNEVRDTKESVREEVRTINQRFEQLIRSSQGFLEPVSLPEAFKYIEEMKETLRASPLSSDQVDKSLASLDPNLRVPAYIELQIRPQISRFEELLDCLYLEQFLARKKEETRPMWQLIETMHCLLGTVSDLTSDRRGYGRFVLSQGLEFLTNNKNLDPGGECKNHLRTLLNRL